MDYPSGRVPGRAVEPSRDGFVDDGACGNFHGFSLGCLGFSRYGDYMGEEAESGAPWVRPRLGGVWPPGSPPSGVLPAHSLLRDFKVLVICPMQFREYFLYNFSEIQK